MAARNAAARFVVLAGRGCVVQDSFVCPLLIVLLWNKQFLFKRSNLLFIEWEVCRLRK